MPIDTSRQPKFELLPDYGHHMTWDDFIDAIARGLTDDDGIASLATVDLMSDIDVEPSDLTYNGRVRIAPLYYWATHVVWFNR